MEKTRFAIVIPPRGAHGYRDMGMKQSLPHIGVAYLAGNIDKRKYEVRVFDCPALGITFTKLADELSAFGPRAVGFSAMTLQINDAHHAARAARSALPDSVFVIGGYHASAVPEETLNMFPEFDLAVFGEGERTISELLDVIAEGKIPDDLPAVNGVCYRHIMGIPRKTTERDFLEDLDSLEYPAYNLMPVDKYVGFYSMFMIPRRTLALSTGRGCPYKCIFCFKATGAKYRTRSIDSVIDEIKRDVRDFDVRELVITDESFLMNHARVKRFCEAVMENGLHKRVNWICQGRVDHAEPRTLMLMKKAGCRVISYGIESGNIEVLRTIKKGIDIEQAKLAVKWAKDAGIHTDTNFILGNPGDTPESIAETIAGSLALDPHSASFALMVPFPGTEVAGMAKRGEGGLRLLSSDYSKFGKQVGGAMELENVSRRQLEKFQRRAYLRFYMRPSKFAYLFMVVDIKMLLLMAWHTAVSLLRPPKKPGKKQRNNNPARS